MISLVTVTQGNPQALRRTIDNVRLAFGGMVNDVVVGDLSVMPQQFTDFDRVRFVQLPFNHLFKRGFASVLNEMAANAMNSLCLYLNVGEVVDGEVRLPLITDSFNCYPFDHATDPHIWVRMWDQRFVRWSGRIHEIIVGPKRQCPETLFRMADTPKDDADDLLAGIYNDVKEMVYFQPYVHLAEHPEDLGGTDPYWLRYGIAELDDLRQRLAAKGDRYQAFIDGDLERYVTCAKKDRPSKIWSKP